MSQLLAMATHSRRLLSTHVVSGESLSELLVVHLDGLDLGGDVRGGEVDDHAGLDDTGLDTSDGNRTDTSDLVNILEGETEGLVRGADGGLDGVDGLEEGESLGDTGLGLLGPSLVPGHAEKGKGGRRRTGQHCRAMHAR